MGTSRRNRFERAEEVPGPGAYKAQPAEGRGPKWG